MGNISNVCPEGNDTVANTNYTAGSNASLWKKMMPYLKKSEVYIYPIRLLRPWIYQVERNLIFHNILIVLWFKKFKPQYLGPLFGRKDMFVLPIRLSKQYH
jgi:hypothetical protein